MRANPVVAVIGMCFVLSLALTLAACGGGSGNSSGGGHQPQPAEFLYAANLRGTIETYSVDMNDGTLAEIGSATGSDGIGVAANPAGTFLYAAEPSTNAIDGYSIGATGALSSITGSPFATDGAAGDGVAGIAVDPSGRLLYATTGTASGGTGTGLLAVFSIDSTTGALSPITGSPFAAGISPEQITVAPSGQFLYVTDSESNILAFSIAAGTPTPISASSSPDGAQALAVTPSSAYIYSVNIDNLISAYSVDSATGSPSQVPGSPFPYSAGTGNYAGAVVVHPTGTFLYVCNIFGSPDTISGFAIDSASGALSPVPGSPFGTNQSPAFLNYANLVIEPSGKFLYASCGSSSCGIVAFNIDATTGALTPVTGSPFNALNYVGNMAIVRVQ
jgi:6-phosphogluconolactonase